MTWMFRTATRSSFFSIYCLISPDFFPIDDSSPKKVFLLGINFNNQTSSQRNKSFSTNRRALFLWINSLSRWTNFFLKNIFSPFEIPSMIELLNERFSFDRTYTPSMYTTSFPIVVINQFESNFYQRSKSGESERYVRLHAKNQLDCSSRYIHFLDSPVATKKDFTRLEREILFSRCHEWIYTNRNIV